MPVRDRNPFGSGTLEEGKADVGVTDPFVTPKDVIKCPICDEARHEKIETKNTPTQILRTCKTCGNVWSGGNVGGLVQVPITDDQLAAPEERAPHPDEDVPPDFRLSGTDEWFD